jgi:pilus assembly protein Flp/PilA
MLEMFVNLQSWIAGRRAEIEERGATAVEYALMVGLIAVGIITAVVALKDKVSTTFQKVGNAVAANN